jgi:hypothetical protein
LALGRRILPTRISWGNFPRNSRMWGTYNACPRVHTSQSRSSTRTLDYLSDCIVQVPRWADDALCHIFHFVATVYLNLFHWAFFRVFAAGYHGLEKVRQVNIFPS